MAKVHQVLHGERSAHTLVHSHDCQAFTGAEAHGNEQDSDSLGLPRDKNAGAVLGRYPSSAMARSTRARVRAVTFG